MDDDGHEHLGMDWSDLPPGKVRDDADAAIRSLRGDTYPDESHALFLVREVERLRAIEQAARHLADVDAQGPFVETAAAWSDLRDALDEEA